MHGVGFGLGLGCFLGSAFWAKESQKQPRPCAEGARMTKTYEGKVTDCVMEGINLWESVYTGRSVNTEMIRDDVFAVCKERDQLLRKVRRLESLLRECSTTLDMWTDVAPAVSLRADIKKALRGEGK